MEDVLKFIKGALDACSPTAQLDAEYDDVGPLMYKIVAQQQHQ